MLRERLPAGGDLTAITEHPEAVGIGELDGVVIEDLAHVLAHADLAAAHALGLARMRLHDPVGDVEVVDVLLDDVVAAEPVEVVPVADLVLHFGLARFAGVAALAGGGVEVDAQERQLAELAAVDPRTISRYFVSCRR